MKIRISAVVIAVIMLAFTLSSCFYANNSTSTEEVTTIAAPDLVKPADAGKIDLAKEDPSTADVSFVYDEDGRVTECAYKKGDVSYYIGYTYRDGEVDVNVFATDKDHNRFNRGSYEATSQDPATATASIGEFDGSPCIKITGVAEGSTSVSLDFLLDGFKLYKSVSVQVK